MLQALIAGLWLAAWPPAGLTAQDPSAIVGRASRIYRSLSSLRADFTQVIEDKMLEPLTAKGTLTQAGENKLAMRFSDPKGDEIISDGQQVWVYTPSTTPGQVLRFRVPTDPIYGFNFLAWVLDRPAERYRLSYVRSDTAGGRTVDVIDMVPLDQSPEFPFRKATAWLDRESGLPRKLVIEERSGGTRTLTLDRIRTNESTPDRTFHFDVPNGVRIIDQR